MSGYEPKVSPVTGKFVLIGVLEVVGHLSYNYNFFLSHENGSGSVAIQNFQGIFGWLKRENAQTFTVILDKKIDTYVRPISSPYTVQKEGNRMEFEFRQKVAILIEVHCECDILFLKEILDENMYNYTVYDGCPW